jgi:hypothetical protein
VSRPPYRGLPRGTVALPKIELHTSQTWSIDGVRHIGFWMPKFDAFLDREELVKTVLRTFHIQLPLCRLIEMVHYVLRHNYMGTRGAAKAFWHVYYLCRLDCKSLINIREFKAFLRMLGTTSKAASHAARDDILANGEFKNQCTYKRQVSRVFRTLCEKFAIPPKLQTFGRAELKRFVDEGNYKNPITTAGTVVYCLRALAGFSHMAQETYAQRAGFSSASLRHGLDYWAPQLKVKEKLQTMDRARSERIRATKPKRKRKPKLDSTGARIRNPMQRKILAYLHSDGPVLRSKLVQHLETPRSTVYDNLRKLLEEVPPPIYKFTKVYGRGRPQTYWDVVHNIEGYFQ